MRILHVGFGFRPLRWGGLIAYAEDLMDAQVARGHRVGYFFAGRAYPFMDAPRLKRWGRRGIAMYEIVNPPVVVGGGFGSAYPAAELDHPLAEAMFKRVLEELDPEVVHVQEMLGLPTSLFGVAREHGVPIMLTTHDYGLLCPTLKLYDADERICRRQTPGEMCVTCCRNAPTSQQGLVDGTMFYEETRFLEASRLKYVPRPRPAVDAVRRANGRVMEWWRDRGGGRPDVPRGEPELPDRPEHPVDEQPAVNPHATPAAYDERRRINVARTSELDLVLAISTRVLEINRTLGVDPAKLRRVQLTLAHIDAIPAREQAPIDGPVRFITLAGCASHEKGTPVILGALQRLKDMGFGPEDFHLSVYGYLEERAERVLPDYPAASWEGFYGPEHMNELFAGQHVGIVSSIWEECYGFVGVEMLAAGLPVIGNAIGGITDYVIDGETGWRNESCDGDGLAEIMAGIIRDPAQVLALNRNVIARRADFVTSLDVHVREMEDVYAGLIAGRLPDDVLVA